MKGRPRDRFGARRIFQVQRPEWEIHKVTSEIRQRAAAEMPPVPPFEMGEVRVIGVLLYRAEPQVPIEVWRHRRAVLRRILPAIHGAGPYVNLPDRANRAALYQFDHAAIIVSSMNLCADLRDEFCLLRQLRDDARLG